MAPSPLRSRRRLPAVRDEATPAGALQSDMERAIAPALAATACAIKEMQRLATLASATAFTLGANGVADVEVDQYRLAASRAVQASLTLRQEQIALLAMIRWAEAMRVFGAFPFEGPMH